MQQQDVASYISNTIPVENFNITGQTAKGFIPNPSVPSRNF